MPQKSHIYMYLIDKGEEYMYVSQKYKYVQQRGNSPHRMLSATLQLVYY